MLQRRLRHRHRPARLRLGRQLLRRQHQPTRRGRHRHLQRLQRQQASIDHPQGIAIDGSGHVWVTNYFGSSITELAGSAASSPGQILSPTTGWASDANFNEAFAVAIDASGNLWITNFQTNILTEIVGLATPVKTPLLGPAQAP